MTTFNKFGVLVASLLASGYASAAVDLADLNASKGDIATVGTAVFGVMVAIKLVHWVRKAL